MMYTKVILPIAITTIVMMCLIEQTSSKPLIEEEIDNSIQDQDLDQSDLSRLLIKRSIPLRRMAFWEYCYNIRNQDPRCREQLQRPRPTIQLIKV